MEHPRRNLPDVADTDCQRQQFIAHPTKKNYLPVKTISLKRQTKMSQGIGKLCIT